MNATFREPYLHWTKPGNLSGVWYSSMASMSVPRMECDLVSLAHWSIVSSKASSQKQEWFTFTLFIVVVVFQLCHIRCDICLQDLFVESVQQATSKNKPFNDTSQGMAVSQYLSVNQSKISLSIIAFFVTSWPFTDLSPNHHVLSPFQLRPSGLTDLNQS